MDDACIPLSKLHMLMDYMSDLGLEPCALIKGLDFDLGYLTGSEDQVISVEKYCQIYQCCMQALVDAGYSVPWSAGMATRFFSVLCHCVKSARTLWDVLERMEEFCSLLDHRYDCVWFDLDADYGYLKYRAEWYRRGDFLRPSRYNNDVQFVVRVTASCITVWQRFCSWLIGKNVDVIALNMGCKKDPDYHPSLIKKFNCTDISYGYDISQLSFSKTFLDFNVVRSESEIDAYMKNAPYHLIVDESMSLDPVASIKSLINNKLSSGYPTFSEVAGNMHMSSSSLRRELVKQGVTYQDIKDESRQSKAVDLLENTDKSIAVISKELGFLEPASFTRFFKTMMGVSPLQFRQRYRKRRAG